MVNASPIFVHRILIQIRMSLSCLYCYYEKMYIKNIINQLYYASIVPYLITYRLGDYGKISSLLVWRYQ
jgi:hypothetical protein